MFLTLYSSLVVRAVT